MNITYNPDGIKMPHRYYLQFPRNACGVEINNIILHAIKHKADIVLKESNNDYVLFDVIEANHHIGHVQYFSQTEKYCSCEQFHKTGTSYCKHIALIDYLINIRYQTSLVQEHGHALYDVISNLKKRKENSYTVYDSLENKVKTIGIKNEPSETGSFITYNRHKTHQDVYETVVLPDPYQLTDKITLFDFQRERLTQMLSYKRGICTMVMGAGKTLTSIGGIKYLNTQNVLIVCPKTILKQWIPEIKKVTNFNSIILNKKNINEFVKNTNQIGLCTYQTLSRNISLLSQRQYDLVIADEIQFIRNDESKTWNSFKKIHTNYFWGLSGTFIENKLDDLYNVLDVVVPKLLGPKWKFDNQFKVLKSLHLTKAIYSHAAKNKEELKKLIKNHVFSYNQLNLPKLNIHKCFITLDKNSKGTHDYFLRKANELISKSLNGETSYADRLMIHAYQLRARQACNCTSLINDKEEPCIENNVKIQKILQLIENVCIKQNEKLVLFSEWTSMLDIIEEFITSCGLQTTRLDGTMTLKERENAIEIFQKNENIKVFLSSDAGNLGVDGLQLVCNHVAHIELPWNPAKLDQRNGRLHRLMQTKEVNAYYFIATDTIEERISQGIDDKKTLRSDVLS